LQRRGTRVKRRKICARVVHITYIGRMRPGFQARVKIGFRKDGRITAMDLFIIEDSGPYVRQGDNEITANVASLLYQPPALRETCVNQALESHPEITAARNGLEAAAAAVREAKADIWVPNVNAFARYSYENNVPFLVHNFGTFGIAFSYDLYDGGRKREVLHEREAQLSQAKETLAQITEEVALAVQTAYNKHERTLQMLKVSAELLALRTESSRVMRQDLLHGAALSSTADMATAREFDAKTLLLQSQYEIIFAMGRTPD